MRLIFGRDAQVIGLVEQAYGLSMGGKPGHAWGVVDDRGELRGAFILTHEHDRTWELNVYGRTSNDTFRAMFKAVFVDLGCYRLQIRTSRKNKAIRKAAPKFGFKFEGVQKHFYGPNEHALCFYMIPQTCRWMKTDGQPL